MCNVLISYCAVQFSVQREGLSGPFGPVKVSPHCLPLHVLIYGGKQINDSSIRSTYILKHNKHVKKMNLPLWEGHLFACTWSMAHHYIGQRPFLLPTWCTLPPIPYMKVGHCCTHFRSAVRGKWEVCEELLTPPHASYILILRVIISIYICIVSYYFIPAPW